MLIENVILVDEYDNMQGTMEKLAAHRLGKLHRAFSVFIFNHSGQLLLQQRALDKYHSAGKWSNTCCSHPRPGEQNIDAAKRRLKEEMGLECDLEYGFNFVYQAEFSNGLSEHEYDHVFFGKTDQAPEPATAEVAGYEYLSLDMVSKRLEKAPGDFSEWFKICFGRVMQYYHQQQQND